MRVFLGGTVDGYNWRSGVMEYLDSAGIEYFNPVVEEYNDEARIKENDEKETYCDVLLFVITNDIAGVYSIAEVVESAIRRGNRLIFCNLYDKHETYNEIRMAGSLDHTEKLLMDYTGYIFHDLTSAMACVRDMYKCEHLNCDPVKVYQDEMEKVHQDEMVRRIGW